MIKRILFDVLGLIVVIIAPWWAALAYGILGCVLFPWYLEIILFGVLFDVIYGTIGGFHFKHALIFSAPVFIIELIKPNIKL